MKNNYCAKKGIFYLFRRMATLQKVTYYENVTFKNRLRYFKTYFLFCSIVHALQN